MKELAGGGTTGEGPVGIGGVGGFKERLGAGDEFGFLCGQVLRFGGVGGEIVEFGRGVVARLHGFPVAEAHGLERALARLPTEHREILLLREIEEMSYEDIAAVLEISLGTVKSRIARARAGLLEKMPR